MILDDLKRQRAAAILDFINDLPSRCIETSPSGPGGALVSVYRHDPRWVARITQDARMTIAPISADKAGARIVRDAGWRLVEVDCWGKSRLVINLRSEEIDLFRYCPGLWESWFGVDSGGDTAAIDRLCFADPKDPAWREILASEDMKRAPLHGYVVPEEPRDDRKLFKRRSPDLQAVTYGPGSPLRVGSVKMR